MIVVLLKDKTAAATSDAFDAQARTLEARTYQASVKGTGAVTATVVIEGSNDGEFFLEIATITLSGTTSDSDGFVSQAAWGFVRARLTAISGTGAAVTVTMGV